MKKKAHKVAPQNKTTMSDQLKSTQAVRSAVTYPEKTTGSDAAAEVRQEANHWSERKRQELFERGMQIIYGGSGNKGKVCTR